MKSRRGLSSVVGAVFAVIALATTVGYITYSMNVLDNYNQSVLARNQQSADTINEKFQITGATFVGNKLNITATNTGTLPINFTKIYITNSSTPSTTAWVKSYSLNSIIVPPASTKTNIGQGVNTWLNTAYAYNVKLVTSRGNTYPFFINSVSQQPLDVKMQTFPPTVSNQFDTEVVMTVTNNATNASPFTNVVPQAPTVDTSSCAPSCTATLVAGPIPASYPVIQPGQTATFKWQYTITGAAANTISFSTGLLNGGSANTASTNVVVRDIVSSLTSGSTLSSKGVGTSSILNNQIFMHTETNFVPSSRFQVMPPVADSAGNTYNDFKAPSLNNIQFFTKNASSGTILMYAGTMNASLRYTHLNKVPENVTNPDNNGQILHFNDNFCGTPPCNEPLESSGSGNHNCYQTADNAQWKPNSSYRPTISTSYGINGTKGARFTGSTFWDLNVDGNCNSPTSSTFSISAWFNADTGGTNKETIWRLGSGATEYYELAIGDGNAGNKGKVYFAFNGGGTSATCYSNSATYLDGKWHQVVAVRSTNTKCVLYVDGSAQNAGTDLTGDTTISPSGEVSIGKKPVNSQTSCACTDTFTGDLDDVLFWNNRALTANEAKSMYHANFGTSATRIGMVVDKTDQNGNKISNIIPLTYKYLPFVDEMHYSGSTSSTDRNYYWAGGNYTITIPQITLAPQQRLNFTFLQYSGSAENADLRVDDINFDGISGDLYSSFIQFPGSNSTMPSYLQYNRCNPLDILVYNAGPYGSWTTYQGTRVTFDNLYGTDSYAGIIHYVNGTRLYSSQDSTFLPVGSTNTFEFYPINNIPNQNNGNYCSDSPPYIAIPDGTYQMNLFISGYSENGGSFLRQVPFGIVNVYG